jgi:hypothetical protein
MRQEYVKCGISLWFTQKDFYGFRRDFLNSGRGGLEEMQEENQENGNRKAMSVLIVSDNSDMRKFMSSKMSFLCQDKSLVYTTCSHSEVADFHSAARDASASFSTVVIDGTEAGSTTRDNVFIGSKNGVGSPVKQARSIITARLVSLLSPPSTSIVVCISDENSAISSSDVHGKISRNIDVLTIGAISKEDFRNLIGRAGA